MTVLEFYDVTKEYEPGRRVLSQISLRVEQGEFVVIVGPSGCGKTTLLRLVAGLERTTSGDIRFDGTSILAESPGDRNVAMVFQDSSLYPHLTVANNMSFGLRARRVSKAECDARVLEQSKRLHLTEYLDRLPEELSGGQRQRVAIGRALVREPRIFLFDEPLAHLDAHLRAELRREIVQLWRENPRTTLYVTHDQQEAMTLGQRLVVLRDGVIQQAGTARELYDAPVNRFVASFLGEPGMNLWPVVVQDGHLQLENTTYIWRNTQPIPTGRYWMGVRPEHLQQAPDDAGQIDVTINSVESLGYAEIIQGSIGSHSVQMRCRVGDSRPVGSRIRLSYMPNQVYFFDWAPPHTCLVHPRSE